MVRELVVATKNKKKLKEIKEILSDLNFKITSLEDYSKPPRIIENGLTFKDNAIKKAIKIARFTKKLTLGEDSGLCVDALGGKPGVYSSRFSGDRGRPRAELPEEVPSLTGRGRNARGSVRAQLGSTKDKSDQKNNLKVLKLLGEKPLSQRKANYICAAALADEKGLLGVVEGKCSGLIGFKEQGSHGFGYDPLFIIPKYKKTFAQLGEKIKHKLSHRYHALKKVKKIIQKRLFRNILRNTV